LTSVINLAGQQVDFGSTNLLGVGLVNEQVARAVVVRVKSNDGDLCPTSLLQLWAKSLGSFAAMTIALAFAAIAA